MRSAPASAVVFLSLLFGAFALAGPPDLELGLPVQRHHSPDDYNGFSQTTAVIQNAEGLLLFGSYGAVIAYDGHTYEKIPVAATFVRVLRRAADDVVWAAGDNQIGVLAREPASGALRYVSRLPLLPPAMRA